MDETARDETVNKYGGTVSNSYDNAHEVNKGDVRVDGPYLDDVRTQQQDAYRQRRTEELNAAYEANLKAIAEKEKAEQEEKEAAKKAVAKKTVAKKVAAKKTVAKKTTVKK